MKITNLKSVFFILLVSIVYSAQSQNTPRELRDLIDMRAAYLDDNMADKGYKFIKNEKSDSDSYSYYWNRNSNKCVVTRTSNGRVASIVNTPSSDCNKYDNHDGHNHSDHSNNHGGIDIDELRGMKSKAAYASLEQHGYDNTKTFQEDDVTYKLWYNSKKDHCVKTYSKNYYIARIENSNNCK